MAANILNSPRAVALSVYVIRAFVKIREGVAANAAILKRLAEIDQTLLIHDTALREVCKLLPSSYLQNRSLAGSLRPYGLGGVETRVGSAPEAQRAQARQATSSKIGFMQV